MLGTDKGGEYCKVAVNYEGQLEGRDSRTTQFEEADVAETVHIKWTTKQSEVGSWGGA